MRCATCGGLSRPGSPCQKGARNRTTSPLPAQQPVSKAFHPTGKSPAFGALTTKAAAPWRVASRPVTTADSPPNRGLKALTLLLALCTLVTSASEFRSIAPALVVIVVIMALLLWLLSRVGLLAVLGVFLPQRRKALAPVSQLSFRVTRGSELAEVCLLGRESGIALGDDVDLRGLWIQGILRAVVVRNRTTGANLWRQGVIVGVTLLAFDLQLLLAALPKMVRV